MKDFLGRVIREGDEIVYARRQSSELWLNRGDVVATGYSDFGPYVGVRADGIRRQVTLHNGAYIVVIKPTVPRQEQVNPNVGKTMIGSRYGGEHTWTEYCVDRGCRPKATIRSVPITETTDLAAVIDSQAARHSMIRGFTNDEAFQMGRRAGYNEGKAEGIREGVSSVLIEFSAFLDRHRDVVDRPYSAQATGR